MHVSLLESESDDELLSGIERGELDLCFALLPLPVGPFVHRELMRDPWMLLFPADHLRGTRDTPVSLTDAAGMPLIGPHLHRCRMDIDVQFRESGLEPNYVFRTDENGAVHGLVAAGLGIGIARNLPSTHVTTVSPQCHSSPR